MDIAAAWRTWVSDTSRTGTAPVGVVEAAVRAAGFAGDALAVERVTHGELNEVYRVGREDGPRVIVRLSRQVPSTFPRERWEIAAAAAQGVPVPDVLLLDEVEAGGERLSVCVLSDLGGRPLQDVAGDPQTPGPDAVAELTRGAGRALARVHAAVAGGFGFLDGEGRGADDGWGAFLGMPYDGPEWYRPTAERGGIDLGRFDAAVALLGRGRAVYTAAPRLLHGDFGPKHVLVGHGGLRGLIDFELCRGGDPAYDVATWDVYFRDTLRTAWLLEGYREAAPVGDDFDLRLGLCRLLVAIRLVAHSSAGFTGFLPLAERTITEGVDAVGRML